MIVSKENFDVFSGPVPKYGLPLSVFILNICLKVGEISNSLREPSDGPGIDQGSENVI